MRVGRRPGGVYYLNKKHEPVILLTLAALLSALVYWQFFMRPVNLVHLAGRVHLDGSYPFWQDTQFRQQMVFAFIALFLLYGIGWGAVRQAHGRLAWGIVLGGCFIFSAVLLWVAPFDAADIYDNIVHGRILGIYGANPFLQVGSAFPGDPFYPFMAWKDSPSAYGPLWEALAGPTARLAGNGIIANVIAFKLLPGLFLAGSIAVAGLLLRRMAPERALAGVLLLAWNPVVLYETLGNGHNDIAMVFWILLSAWALSHSRYSSAILALIAGTLIKFIPVLLIPAAGVVALSRLPGWKSRLRYLLLTGLAAAILIALAYAPFWDGLQTLSMQRREQLFTATLPASVFQILKPHLGTKGADDLVSRAAASLTLLFALWQGLRLRNPAHDPDPDWVRFGQAAYNIMMFYLLVTCLWFQQWYTLWPIGVAALLPAGPSQVLAILFNFVALDKQFIIGPILFRRRPYLPQPWLEIRFALSVLGLIWVSSLAVMARSVLARRKEAEHET